MDKKEKEIKITWKHAYWAICQSGNIVPKKGIFEGKKYFISIYIDKY